jgi:transposase
VVYICHMKSNETVTISKAEYQEFLSLKSEVDFLNHQLAQFKRMIFGSKRERFVAIDGKQLSLFKESEQENKQEPQQEQVSYTRRKASKEKKQPVRTELPAHLKRVDEIIEPENIPQDAVKIGESVTEILEMNISEPYVRRIIRPKYITSQSDEKTEIAIAPMPTLPIPKGNAGASMLAYILVSKYVDHLPFYRQVQILKRQNIFIAESTINGWYTAAAKLITPVYERMIELLLKAGYLQADETPMPVLTKNKPGATHKGYQWVYYDPLTRMAVFKYEKSRGREGPNNFLENFSGYLQTDGYKAYNNLNKAGEIIQLACMAHARRKFEHALENDKARATEALTMFKELYDIERELRQQGADYQQIKEYRQQHAVPVLQKMKKWLDENLNQTFPKSAIGQAIAYTLSLRSRLRRYVEDGWFQIDNNLIENSIRPVALGRKNYLFAGSHESAQYAAVMYSIFASCKINNVNPFEYLKHTLSVISDYPAKKIDDLLPQNFRV